MLVTNYKYSEFFFKWNSNTHIMGKEVKKCYRWRKSFHPHTSP